VPDNDAAVVGAGPGDGTAALVQAGPGDGTAALVQAGPGDGTAVGPRATGWLARHPAWPLTALLAGYPLWWALGVSDYMFVIMAVPMAARMWAWGARGDRKIRVPPGFGLWALFLLVMLVGVVMLPLDAPGTIASPVSNRLISYSIRAASYLGVTVLLLYAGNLTERELSRRRLAWLLGLVAIYATVGGVGGVVLPHLKFTSPLAFLVPQSLQQSNLLLQAMLHPGLAQVQSALGAAAHGRPNAPFVYTNEWGNCLALLLPWLLVAWWCYGTRRERKAAVAALAVVPLPIIYSLDKGLWLGLLCAIAYLALRLAARGRAAMLGGLLGMLALAAVIIVASPLQSLISQRLSHSKSTAVRQSLSVAATRDALASPLLGYGDTRHQQGSVQSIAVGRSANCQQCGEVTVGSNGQLWLLLICSGFLGAALYLGFFAFGAWRYWRDTTPYGMAGVLVLLLTFVFMVAYSAVGAPLGFSMLAYALLWRNERAMRLRRAPADAAIRAAGSRPARAEAGRAL
jgi:hypothetical protein